MTFNPRYYSVVHRLSALGMEIVQNVLSDIQIQVVLDLITLHDAKFIEGCIYFHPDLSRILTPNTLPDIKRRNKLYLKIAETSRSPNPRLFDIPFLQQDAFSFLQKGHTSKDVVKALDTAIHNLMSEYGRYLPILRRFSEDSLPDVVFWEISNINETERVFQALSVSEKTLNMARSSQLERLATLLKDNSTLLKPMANPGYLKNSQHVVNRLQHEAKSVLKSTIIGKRTVPLRSIFGRLGFYLVPLDRCLQIFLKVLDKYPADKHDYPPELGMVLAGLTNITANTTFIEGDTQKSLKTYPRTHHTRYSVDRSPRARGYKQPCFETEHSRTERIVGSNATNIRSDVCLLEEKEFLWIENFVKICRHLENMDEKWKSGRTVGEYWHLHIG